MEEIIDTNLVSLIVPIYNVQSYLVRCIESLIEQTYKKIEIILVNDGSTDNSGRICDEFGNLDARIKVIHKKNGGLSDARNAGIDVAKGDYLFFVDADDWIERDTINVMLERIIDTKSDICCCGIDLVFDDGKTQQMTHLGDKIFTREEALVDYLHGCSVCVVAWNKLYAKKLFLNIRYPIKRLNEDEFTTYKLIMRTSRICYLDNVKYHYFQRSNSIMGSKSIVDKLDMFDAWVERMTIFKENKLEKMATETWIQILDFLYYYKTKKEVGDNARKKMIQILKINQQIRKELVWEGIPLLKKVKSYIKLLRLQCMQWENNNGKV